MWIATVRPLVLLGRLGGRGIVEIDVLRVALIHAGEHPTGLPPLVAQQFSHGSVRLIRGNEDSRCRGAPESRAHEGAPDPVPSPARCDVEQLGDVALVEVLSPGPRAASRDPASQPPELTPLLALRPYLGWSNRGQRVPNLRIPTPLGSHPKPVDEIFDLVSGFRQRSGRRGTPAEEPNRPDRPLSYTDSPCNDGRRPLCFRRPPR